MICVQLDLCVYFELRRICKISRSGFLVSTIQIADQIRGLVLELDQSIGLREVLVRASLKEK
jgi:hypothetical protein